MNQLQFYKPNPSAKGHACSFWRNSEDNTFWCSMIKQHRWNAKTRIGSFSENKDDPQKRVIVKFSVTEICAIIDSILRNSSCDGYHGSNQIVKYKFGPYQKEGKQVGFSFGVQKEDKEDSTNKQSYIIGFTFPESRLLVNYLETIVKQSFLSGSKDKDKSREEN